MFKYVCSEQVLGEILRKVEKKSSEAFVCLELKERKAIRFFDRVKIERVKERRK